MKITTQKNFLENWVTQDIKTSTVKHFYNTYLPILKWIADNNQSRPYHNTRHLIGAGVIAFYLCKELGVKENIAEIVIAALVHDFHHQGKPDDKVNIRHSIHSLNQLGFWQTFPDVNYALVEKFVKFTEYDFDNPKPKVPTVHGEAFRILRDADQLYATIYLDEEIFMGLYSEIGVRFGQSRAEFIQRNIDYIKLLNLYSYPAWKLHGLYLGEAVETCMRMGTSEKGEEKKASVTEQKVIAAKLHTGHLKKDQSEDLEFLSGISGFVSAAFHRENVGNVAGKNVYGYWFDCVFDAKVTTVREIKKIKYRKRYAFTNIEKVIGVIK